MDNPLTDERTFFYGTVCSRCKGPGDRAPYRYCRACVNAYKREHRPKYRELDEETRRKGITRAYTRVLVKRGQLDRGPCRDCGTTENVHGHHPDYSDPWRVIWLCAPCHRHEHWAHG